MTVILRALPLLLTCAALVAQDRVVTGRVVVKSDGASVAGAEIRFFGGVQRGRDRAPLGRASAAEDGSFRVEGLTQGPLVIQVEKDGFARVNRFLRTDEEGAALLIELEPGRDARGLIMDRGTRAPIAGALVTAGFHAVFTDEAGRFLMRGLPRGSTEDLPLEISAQGYVPVEVPLPSGDDEFRLELGLEPGHVVAVKVTDAGGEPRPGVSVRIRLPMAVAYSALERATLSGESGADGVAVITGLPPHHPVAAEAMGAVAGIQSDVGTSTAPFRGGVAPSPGLNLVVDEGRSVTMTVRDGHGRPIQGAELRVLPLVEPMLDFGGGVVEERQDGGVRTARTDAEGAVSWSELPHSRLTCEVRAPGWRSAMVLFGANDRAVDVALQPDEDPPGVALRWRSSIPAAFRESAETGLPLMISMAMDGERANDWMAAHHFRDPEIIRVTRELPVVLTNVFGPGGVPSGISHEERDGVCSRYGGIPCAAHQSGEQWCRDELIGPGVAFQVPRHIFLSPDGEELMHRAYYLSERDLVWMVVRALRHIKPERATDLARVRLARLRHRLVSLDPARRAAAAADLVALINSGDEYAVALLADLVPSGVSPSIRVAVARGIIVDAVRFCDSALRPLMADPDPLVRQAMVAGVARARPSDALVRLCERSVVDQDARVASSARNAIGVGVRANNLVVLRPTEGERWRLVDRLVRARGAVEVDGLATVLGRGAPTARNRVIRTLAREAEHDPRAMKLLLKEARRPGLPALAALRALRAHPPSGQREALDGIMDLHFGGASALLREEAMHLAGVIRTAASADLLRDGVEDWEPRVQVAAALALVAWRDEACVPVLLRWADDPVMGEDIRRRLREVWGRGAPQDASDWRRWFIEEGLLEDEEGTP